MKRRLLPLLLLSLLLTHCGGSDPNPPAVGDISFDQGTVTPGTTMIVSIELFLSTSDFGGKSHQSDPLSLLVTLPPGATYVPGSSHPVIQGNREPNATGACGDGRTFLLYDFGPAEFDNSFEFDHFTDEFQLSTVLQLAANDAKVFAGAFTAPPTDPCGQVLDDNQTFSVKAS